MFSKTGNTVDSQVNQAIHQGGVPGVGVHDPLINQGVHGVHNPLINQGVHGVHGVHDPLINQGVHGGHVLPGQGVTSHLPGHGVSSHLPGQGLTSHLPGHGVSGLHGQNLHGVNPTVTQDQTLGHSGLGTVQGFVGQGVSTGLGFHSNPVLPHPPVDAGLHDTRHGHHGATTAGVVGAGSVAGAHHAHKVKTGRGTLTFRPIEARFNHDKDLLGKMDPYCKFKVGMHRGKSEVAKGQGVAPVWNDAVIVKHKNQEFAKLKVKDHDKLRIDDTIGTAKIPLDQVLLSRNVDLWVPVSKKDKVTGEVHLIIEYTPRDTGLNTVETAAV